MIPSGVEVIINGTTVRVKGPKGELTKDFNPAILISKEGSMLIVTPKNENKTTRALWGTVRQGLANMIQGVNQEFTKQLQIEGIGYRASVENKNLILNVGFTHPITIEAKPGISFKVEKNIVTVSGVDKDLVSMIAAQTRRVKPPEPYKGKGIRYVGERVRKKVGKKAVAATK